MRSRGAARTLTAGSVAAAMLIVSACGSSGGGDNSTGGSSSSGDLVIGVMTPQSGPNAATGKAVVAGVKARIDEANAAGGIQGHKIKLAIGDDQGLPANAPGAARKLVETDKVLAMDTSFSASAAATLPYLKQNKVLNIPTNGSSALIADPASTYRLYVPNYDVLSAAVVKYGVEKLGVKTIAVAYTDDAVGQPTLAGVESEAKSLGVKVVARVTFSATATSAAAQAAQLKQANADMVVLIHVPAVATVVIKANQQVGYNPIYGSAYPMANPILPQLMGKSLDGKIYFATPFVSPDSADAKDYRDGMKKAGANFDDTNALNGFSATDTTLAVLDKAVTAAGGKAPTRQQVLDATNGFTLNDDYVRGLAWTSTVFKGSTKSQITTLKDGKYSSITGFDEVPNVR
jgi:branched-chain amino acid transport system substrate-binding protein